MVGLTLICGRSRAGKSVYSRRYGDVLHLDTYGLVPYSYAPMLEKIKTTDKDVVLDGIYDTAERRTDLLKAYKGKGKRVCIWLDTPLDVIEKRFLPNRPSKFPHPFEPPTLSEGWNEIIIIRGDDNVECHRR